MSDDRDILLVLTSRLKVTELKSVLRTYGLKLTGLKADLQDRLINFMQTLDPDSATRTALWDQLQSYSSGQPFRVQPAITIPPSTINLAQVIPNLERLMDTFSPLYRFVGFAIRPTEVSHVRPFQKSISIGYETDPIMVRGMGPADRVADPSHPYLAVCKLQN